MPRGKEEEEEELSGTKEVKMAQGRDNTLHCGTHASQPGPDCGNHARRPGPDRLMQLEGFNAAREA